MEKINTTKETWEPNIDKAIESGPITAFKTKKEAVEKSREFGWLGKVVHIQRRFEKIWIVGDIDFQPSKELDLIFDQLRVPLLRYEKSQMGVDVQPVIKFRKLRN